jgi:hypothetical protein
MNEQVTPLSLARSLEAVEAGGFEAFFRDERSRLFGSMLLVTGDSHEAEELVQEAFFKVWERWDRSFGAYACGSRGDDAPGGRLGALAGPRPRRDARRSDPDGATLKEIGSRPPGRRDALAGRPSF